MLNEMDRETPVHKKVGNVKYQRANESLIPALEDEAIEVQHLLAEPKTDNVSVDGVLCFGKENSVKSSETVDFSYGLEFGLTRNFGGLSPGNTQVQDELELGVLDGLLDDVDEVDDILAANDISGACEDFLLDVELADKVLELDCSPHEASLLGNTSSESQSPGFSGSSSGAIGLSESSMATVPDSESKNCLLDQVVECKENVLSGDKWACQAPSDVSNKFPEHDLKNIDGLENDVKPSISGILLDGNEQEVIQATKVGMLVGQKRLRKPTKRYIEEFSDPKAKHAMESEKLTSFIKDKSSKFRSFNEEDSNGSLPYSPKEESISEIVAQATCRASEKLLDVKPKHAIRSLKTSNAMSKEKRLKIRVKNECHVKVVKSAAKEDSFTGTTDRAESESQPRRGRPRKFAPLPVIESDDQLTSDSEDDHVKRRSKKRGDRRKHQRMWTLSEVTNLVDGIAQFGTGRWTDIKKLLFSSSAYRTPIDLRDKWRNLLRASCAQKQRQHKKEAEEKLKQSMRPLPKSVLRRIRELSSIHPYPRFSPGGRYTRKKN